MLWSRPHGASIGTQLMTFSSEVASRKEPDVKRWLSLSQENRGPVDTISRYFGIPGLTLDEEEGARGSHYLPCCVSDTVPVSPSPWKCHQRNGRGTLRQTRAETWPHRQQTLQIFPPKTDVYFLFLAGISKILLFCKRLFLLSNTLSGSFCWNLASTQIPSRYRPEEYIWCNPIRTKVLVLEQQHWAGAVTSSSCISVCEAHLPLSTCQSRWHRPAAILIYDWLPSFCWFLLLALQLMSITVLNWPNSLSQHNSAQPGGTT